VDLVPEVSARRATGGSDPRQSWRTPPALVRELACRYAGGSFLTDPCTDASNHLGCGVFHTEEDDGLSHYWHGSVFVNPPYSNIAPWVEKAIDDARCNRIDVIVMLLPSRTDQAWWHDLEQHAELMVPIRGRVQFLAPPGIKVSSNREPVVAWVLRRQLTARDFR
tara:strand:+ start:182 stop:676 length:495 start_codon:yes stop_codon:yes gene_type:complete